MARTLQLCLMRGKVAIGVSSLCMPLHRTYWYSMRVTQAGTLRCRDPDFKTPEQYEKEHWTNLVARMA